MRDYLNDPEARRTFEEEVLFSEARDTLVGLVESSGVSRSELAKRLGVSKGRVSQILGGGDNLTLRTIAAVGWALGVEFGLRPTAMKSRSGTPAADDPPAPEWLADMCAEPVTFRFTHVERVRPSHPVRGHMTASDFVKAA